MKASEARLLEFLKKSPQFVVPIYQRTYSWTEKECQQLWDDVIRCGKDDRVAVHFVGSIVYIEAGLSQVSHQAPLLVIDGQQRLTTVTLMLAALADAIGDGEPFEGFSQRKIRNYFLLNPEEEGDRHFKLLLSQTDKTSLTALVGKTKLPAESSLRVTRNFEFFNTLLNDPNVDLTLVCKGLAKLVIVDVALTRDQDNPQLIFESMNSTGKELSQADLIRNFVLMGLEQKLQTKLYEQYWRPMELAFGQEAYGTHFDSFMRHYLTLKSGEIPRLDAVYEAFKDHAHRTRLSATSDDNHVEQLVRDIHTFAGHFCAMALGAEEDIELRRTFNDLRELKVDVAYPFLLELYDDHSNGQLNRDEMVQAVRLVEAYVFRRAVCAIPTNSLNKTFATFAKALKKDRYLESIKAHFLLLPSYRRFPGDDEFRRALEVRDLYHIRSRSYWLRRFENYKRKEHVPVDEYTVEHILPQNPQLSAGWQSMLGPEWKAVQEKYLHTLGNLTLTGYNSEYSDRPFAEKRDMQGGFKFSPLKLNEGLGHLDNWGEIEIAERASRLAKLAVEVWKFPALPTDILTAYGPQRVAGTTYSIEDHPHLLAPGLRPVFEALRRAILALDECVNEEFLKLYVAYKAETNFVDVIPQAKRLVLLLNMGFAEINDPKGLCSDVAGKGRWGNGEVEVPLATVDQLPYVVGLVRQSLDLQMGDAST